MMEFFFSVVSKVSERYLEEEVYEYYDSDPESLAMEIFLFIGI